jgi:multiple sugar transport system permease protein
VKNNYKLKKVIGLVALYTLLVLGAIVTLLPFYWMLITSFMTRSQAISATPTWFVNIFDGNFENYKKAFFLSPEGKPMLQFINFLETSEFIEKITFLTRDENGNTYATFGTFFFNSFFTTIINTIATIFTTILAAFAFSKIEFKGKNRLFGLLLATMMVPGEMLLITNLVTIYQLNWVDTYKALIVPFTASVFYIYLLRQVFMQIPDSLYRAARVDGCGDWKFLWKVLVPMSKNTLVTVAILNAIASWNAYLWPLLVTSQPRMYVLSVGLVKFSETISTMNQPPDNQILMAGSTLVILPMIIIYVLLRKQIISGVTRSGTKG